MRPDFVVLADRGHARDGLAYIIGGGINRVQVRDLPATVQASIVAKIVLDDVDFDRDHVVRVRVNLEDGDEQVAVLEGDFHPNRPAQSSWEHGWVTSISLDGLVLPAFGFYRLSFEVDDQLMKAIRVEVQRLVTPGRAARRHTGKPDPTVRPRRKR
jgi:hypothetical protein